MREKIQVALYLTDYDMKFVACYSGEDSDRLSKNIRVSNIVIVEFEDRNENELMQAKVAAVEIEIEQANNVLQKALQKKQDLLSLEYKE